MSYGCSVTSTKSFIAQSLTISALQPCTSMLFAEVVNTVVKEENFGACLISWKSLESFARKVLRLLTRINTQKNSHDRMIVSCDVFFCVYDLNTGIDIVIKHNPKFRLKKNLQIPNYRITDK